jgi:hexosaminidase
MNFFHWHLTDDQGWRIEIKKYPKLLEIGAWRKGTLIGHFFDMPVKYDSIPYGGFYTKDEIRSIVKYASERHITIIPEIEMPGHAQAALASYPEYSCTGGPFEVGKTWGVYKDVFCPKEETFVFLEGILDEVCDLFPGKYIHIGGDECPKDRWKNCDQCRKLILKENLIDENGIQQYFSNRISSYLKSKNKIALGWDEILNDKLDTKAAIMSWKGYAGGIEAAKRGHDVVMNPYTHCYFDSYQSRDTAGKLAIGGYLPLDMVYRFEPVPEALTNDQALHIMGAQGNVWSEYITNEEQLNEMVFPRICALSEVLWSPKEKRNYAGFTSRLKYHFKFLYFNKINFSNALYDEYLLTQAVQ